jgi:hypothetical protein
MVKQINVWQCTHSVYTHKNSYARSLGMPTGLTEDLIMGYLHNSIKWHTFGDLERIVKLRRDRPLKGSGFGGQKRALEELDVNVARVKRTKINDRQYVRICSGNTRL